MFIDLAVSEQPALRVLSRRWRRSSVDRMSCGDADGSTFHEPGAISPSSLRWSSPMRLTGLVAQSGTDNSAERLQLPAALRRSSADTQCRSPSRSTQVALEIRLKMPSVTSLVLTSWMSSSWRPSGITSLPTRFCGSVSRATAFAAGISVRIL